MTDELQQSKNLEPVPETRESKDDSLQETSTSQIMNTNEIQPRRRIINSQSQHVDTTMINNNNLEVKTYELVSKAQLDGKKLVVSPVDTVDIKSTESSNMIPETKTPIDDETNDIKPEDVDLSALGKEIKKDNEEKLTVDTDMAWEQEIAKSKKEKEEASKPVEKEPIVSSITKEQILKIAKLEKELTELKAHKKEVEKKKESTDKPNEEINKKNIEDIINKNKAAGFLYTHNGNDEDMEAAFDKEMESDDRTAEEKREDPSKYALGLSICNQMGLKTSQGKLIADWIKQLEDLNINLSACIKEFRLARINPNLGDGKGPKKLSGSAAKAAVISRQKGMFRVQLYNSGFWLTLRPPTLVDINSFIMSVDTEFKELGRVLGGHSYTCIGVFIKQKLMEILPSLIVNSNFEKYDDPQALLDNISIHDYEVILWALSCLMYRDGVAIGIYCVNPECRYIDDKQYVDLTNLCYLNTEIFNKKAMDWMLTGVSKNRTEEDLLNYRTNILNLEKRIEVDNGLNEYVLKVPTMGEYIANGSSLVAALAINTNGEKNIQTEIVVNQITFNLYKMLTPWVKGFVMKDENKNILYYTEDTEAIYESLDVSNYIDTELYKKTEEFMRDSKISFFTVTTLECPKCHKRPDLTKDHMHPLDMEYVFFGLSCLKLEQTGASL